MSWFNSVLSRISRKKQEELPVDSAILPAPIKENQVDISEAFAISETYAIEREKARVAQEPVTTTPINQELEECNNRLTACTLQLSEKESEISSVMEKCNILLSMVDTLKKELGKKEIIEIIKEVPVEVIKEVIKEVPVEVIKEVEVCRFLDTPGVAEEAKRYRFIREHYRSMAILWLPGNSGDIFSVNLSPNQPTNPAQFDTMMNSVMLTGSYQR